jgi:3-deoxy-D-manno-octulosonic acid kinase
MFENFSIPPSFSLVQRGKVFLLLHEKYKDFLLHEGIEDTETFLQRYRQASKYLMGRTLHPSIPIKDGERLVIRRYSHGGLLRAVTRDLYLFGSRSFQELALTEGILSCGISTIQPIGAIHQLIFSPLYKAYLLSLEVPQAIDLIQYFKGISLQPSPEKLLLKRRTIHSAGRLLREFHKAGFFHGDLQLKNILVAGDRTLLIDFDRSCRKKLLSNEERMRNLLRLNRSVEKWKRHGLRITWTDRLRFFRAYADDDAEICEVIQRAFRNYPLRLFLHRLSWLVDRIFGKNKDLSALD